MNYIEYFIETLRKVDIGGWTHIKDLILNCHGRILIIGNGGSLVNATHIANDLMKIRHKNAIALDNIALLSAYANDLGYEKGFLEQLRKVNLRNYDMLLAITGGLSKNIMSAAKYCLDKCPVVLVTEDRLGEDYTEDKLREYADYLLAFPTDSMITFENLTSLFGHYLVS